MTFKIFRKSENKNSFGLRGYWAFNPGDFAVVSFASTDELDKGDTVSHRVFVSMELLKFEGRVPQDKQSEFLKMVAEACEAKGVPA